MRRKLRRWAVCVIIATAIAPTLVAAGCVHVEPPRPVIRGVSSIVFVTPLHPHVLNDFER
jgi:hypothetical protein